MPAARSALVALTTAALVWATEAASAQTNTMADMFPTRAAAEKRAQ